MTTKNGIVIIDLGAVASVTIPPGWVEAARQPEFGGRTLRKFHPAGLPDVRFCSYYRAEPLSQPASKAFQQVIYGDFHALSQEELNTLDDVLEGMSNPLGFEVMEATTGYLNMQRVLKIKGRWLESKHDSLCLFTDAQGDGEIVQQIYFAAPGQEFTARALESDQIFHSIEWKR